MLEYPAVLYGEAPLDPLYLGCCCMDTGCDCGSGGGAKRGDGVGAVLPYGGMLLPLVNVFGACDMYCSGAMFE
jgi:hypothetical protein